MCAIIGFSGKKGFNAKLLKLLNESKIRGLHAFGVSYYKNGVLSYSKHLSLVDLKQKISSLDCEKLLIHCRYSTSGDYSVLENNQPIVGNESHLIFNGIVSMATKEENEKFYKEKYNTDNDGEIVLRMIENGQNHIEFIKSVGSFAGGCLNNKGELIMFRNRHRPMHYCEDEFGTWFGSTKDIFKRSGFANSKECDPLVDYVK